MTEAITDIVEDLKHKEFFKSDVNARATATWIQAYTLGKLVNDYNPTGVTENEWVDFIMSIVEKTFIDD